MVLFTAVLTLHPEIIDHTFLKCSEEKEISGRAGHATLFKVTMLTRRRCVEMPLKGKESVTG